MGPVPAALGGSQDAVTRAWDLGLLPADADFTGGLTRSQGEKLAEEKVPSAPPLAMPCSLAQAMAGRYHSMPKLSLKGSSSPISTSGLPAAS